MASERQTPRPTTIAEVRPLITMPVWSQDEPSWAGVMRLQKWNAYEQVRKGNVPVIKVGRTYRVLVAPLLRMLGEDAR